MPRNAQVIRFMALLRELDSSHGLYAPRMAKRLNVSRRTLYRDLQAIEESGYPLYQDRSGVRTMWRFTESYRSGIKELSISSTEMLALWTALGFVRNLEGTFFEADLSNLIQKIESLNKNGNGLRKLGKTLFLKSTKGAKDYSAHGETIRSLLKSILNSTLCRLDYHSFASDKLKTLEIHPYHLSEYRKGLYVHCYCVTHGKVLMLAIERIRKMKVTERQFEPDETLDFDSMYDSSFGIVKGKPTNVELIFDKRVANYILEREWHPSQKIKIRKDGKVKLSIKVGIDYELIHWICGYGPLVKVDKPLTLRKQLLQRHVEAVAI